LSEKRYIVNVDKFKFRGKWRKKGDIISMNIDECVFFLPYVKPYKIKTKKEGKDGT